MTDWLPSVVTPYARFLECQDRRRRTGGELIGAMPVPVRTLAPSAPGVAFEHGALGRRIEAAQDGADLALMGECSPETDMAGATEATEGGRKWTRCK